LVFFGFFWFFLVKLFLKKLIEKEISYNCTSSLWFMKVFGELFPFLNEYESTHYDLIKINDLIKEFYESQYIKAILQQIFFLLIPRE